MNALTLTFSVLAVAATASADIQDVRFLEVRNGGIRLRVSVRAGEFTYELTNLSIEPVVEVELPQKGAYVFSPAPGWSCTLEKNRFRAVREPSSLLIGNETAKFQYRVGSQGAVLGQAEARLRLANGRVVTLGPIWVPLSEPKSAVVVVAGTVACLAGLHALFLAWLTRSRRNRTVASGSATPNRPSPNAEE